MKNIVQKLHMFHSFPGSFLTISVFAWTIDMNEHI